LGLPVVPAGLAGLTGSVLLPLGVDGATGVDGPEFVCAVTGVAASAPANINAAKSGFMGISYLNTCSTAD
jgi:hypothetical protein